MLSVSHGSVVVVKGDHLTQLNSDVIPGYPVRVMMPSCCPAAAEAIVIDAEMTRSSVVATAADDDGGGAGSGGEFMTMVVVRRDHRHTLLADFLPTTAATGPHTECVCDAFYPPPLQSR